MITGGEGNQLLFHLKMEVPYHITKKNNSFIFRDRRTGRAFLGKKSRLVEAENYLLLHLRQAKIHHKITEPFRFPMHLRCIFGMCNYKTSKGLRSLKINDQSNLYQAIEDCLQKAEIIHNDVWIDSHDGSRRIPSDHNFLEISLFKFKD